MAARSMVLLSRLVEKLWFSSKDFCIQRCSVPEPESAGHCGVLGRSWGGFVLQEVLISSGECLLLPSSHLGGALETLPGSIPCKSLLGSVCG